ncbi:hypothetical protein UFOVP124_47 [uncultured Caudovirales phage]|uniref:Uncharacterized protein n=1 Tax=uncultured Caudovirales phage TaxID=2100421 RepID=A0A6J5LDH0_9CAUD|nr:hypothetical protein UFOVP124_47 [uncultured Caudovirales phage]
MRVMCRANGMTDTAIDALPVAELRELIDVWCRTGRALTLETWRE